MLIWTADSFSGIVRWILEDRRKEGLLSAAFRFMVFAPWVAVHMFRSTSWSLRYAREEVHWGLPFPRLKTDLVFYQSLNQNV